MSEVCLDTPRDRQQADELMAAGWKWELPPNHATDIFQWKWRRPPRRAGQKGRLFLSTNQAWRGMMRDAGRTCKSCGGTGTRYSPHGPNIRCVRCDGTGFQ